MSVSVVLKNACETTGEGPHWDERSNHLLFVDILANDAHRWSAETGKHEKKHFGKELPQIFLYSIIIYNYAYMIFYM